MSRLRIEIDFFAKIIGYSELGIDNIPTQDEIDDYLREEKDEIYKNLHNDLSLELGFDDLEEKELVINNIKVEVVE